MAWHSSAGASISEVDSTILSDPSRIINADETDIVLDPSPKKVIVILVVSLYPPKCSCNQRN